MDYKYFAFISYQRSDEEWARWLHHQLEHYHLPTQLVANNPDLPNELRPLFLDEAELAGGNLSEKIHQALLDSRFLIVLCSPNSARSIWVNKEVETFIALHRIERIIPLIISGTPYSDDENECFTPALKALRATEHERLAINAKYGREMASVKVVAELLGVRFDDLWSRYEREKEEERLHLKAHNDRLLAFQSRAWSSMATQLVGEGDALLAQKLAVEALPHDFEEPERPLVSEAEVALRQAVEAERSHACYALLHHKDSVTSMTLSPDGRTLATTSGSYIYLWDLDTALLREVVDANICLDLLCDKLLHYGPDGELYGIDCGDDLVAVNLGADWPKKDFDESRVKRTAIFWRSPHKKYKIFDEFHVSRFLFRPGTHTMYIVSREGEVAMWDADEQRVVGERHVLLDYYGLMTFTPDGRYIAFVCDMGERKGIMTVDADTFALVDVLPVKGDYVFSLCFSPDGSRLAWTSNADTNIHLYDFDVKNGWFVTDADYSILRSSILEGHEGYTSVGGFTSDGKYLISLSRDCTLRMWNLETKRYYRPNALQIERLLRNHLLFLDERRMVVNDGSRTLRLWNYRLTRSTFGLGDQGFYAQCFSPDERYFAYVKRFDDGRTDLRLLDLQARTSRTIHTEAKDGRACQLLFSRDGQRLYCLRGGETMLVYDLVKEEMSRYELPVCLSISVRLSLLPDDRYLVGATVRGALVVCDLIDYTVRTVAQVGEEIYDVALDCDGTHAIVSKRGWVLWYDIQTGQRTRSRHVTYGNYGREEKAEIACGIGCNQTAYSIFQDLYVESYHQKRPLRIKAESDIASMAFSADGALFAAGCQKGEVVWYDLATEQVGGRLSLGDEAFVSFIPHSHQLAIATRNENMLRVWNLETNDVQEYGEVDSNFAEKVLVSPNGRYVVVVGNCMFRLYDFATLTQLAA